MKANLRKGFTLVELSIVFVIIGLLIGGILAANSMMQTAKVTRFVRQVQQFDIARTNFKTKYNQLPGDSTFFATAGNNDGYIRDASQGDGDFDGEAANYWKHLSEAGLLATAYTDVVSGSAIKLDVNIPKSEIGKDAGIMAGCPNDAGAPDNISPVDTNIYFISNFINGAGFDTNNGVAAVDAAAADIKMDDGSANSGNMVAQGAGTDISDSPSNSAAGGIGCVIATNKAKYNVSSSNSGPCSVLIIQGSMTSKQL